MSNVYDITTGKPIEKSGKLAKNAEIATFWKGIIDDLSMFNPEALNTLFFVYDAGGGDPVAMMRDKQDSRRLSDLLLIASRKLLHESDGGDIA